MGAKMSCCGENLYEVITHVKMKDKKKKKRTKANINDVLPNEMIMHVLNFVPPKDVILRCSQVCKQWNLLCKQQLFWLRKCEAEKKFVRGLMGPYPESFMKVYFNSPYTGNLLRNSHALEGTKFWELSPLANPIVEELPSGVHDMAEYIPAEEIQGRTQNWVLSEKLAYMTQCVNLRQAGISEEVLNEICPPIKVSLWFALHEQSAAVIHMSVRLMWNVEAFEMMACQTDRNMRKKWIKFEHTFKNYRPGLEEIVFRMGGWSCEQGSNYGPKFALPSVRFDFGNQQK